MRPASCWASTGANQARINSNDDAEGDSYMKRLLSSHQGKDLQVLDGGALGLTPASVEPLYPPVTHRYSHARHPPRARAHTHTLHVRMQPRAAPTSLPGRAWEGHANAAVPRDEGLEGLRRYANGFNFNPRRRQRQHHVAHVRRRVVHLRVSGRVGECVCVCVCE
jgi:hypothetical protein